MKRFKELTKPGKPPAGLQPLISKHTVPIKTISDLLNAHSEGKAPKDFMEGLEPIVRGLNEEQKFIHPAHRDQVRKITKRILGTMWSSGYAQHSAGDRVKAIAGDLQSLASHLNRSNDLHFAAYYKLQDKKPR